MFMQQAFNPGILPSGEAFLAGSWNKLSRTIPVMNPWTGANVIDVAAATKTDVETAIEAAEAAFLRTRRLAAYERSAACQKISSLLSAQAERFAQLITLELGKTIRESRLEVFRAAAVFAIAAEEAKRIGGDVIDLDWSAGNEERLGLVRRFPLGVIAGITPFNFPLNLVAHKIAPAMAAGNCMVLKPASRTPLSALALAGLIHQSGYPTGAISILPAAAAEAAPLLTDPRVRKVTFTGSDAVGWELQRLAVGKRVTLELGGNAAVIVADDANSERAATRIVSGAFGVAGQSCISVQRIYVHRDIADRLVPLLVKKAAVLKTGDPSDELTDVGLLIDATAIQRTEGLIRDALAHGAKLLTGGEADPQHPLLFRPTLLTDVPERSPICSQELFAPVAVIELYDDFADVIGRVNRSAYGLQAGLFTSRLGDILRAWREIECGGIIVSDIPTWRVDQMPYGGVKRSGLGREGIRYAIQEMTELKLLALHPESE